MLNVAAGRWFSPRLSRVNRGLLGFSWLHDFAVALRNPLAWQPVEAELEPVETTMHKDEVKGAAKEARGNVKDAIGKVTGDTKLRADGAADKAEGKVQQMVGKTKEAARDALKK
jgi:uncharacterized protein YjbJ (UPF0337 family)